MKASKAKRLDLAGMRADVAFVMGQFQISERRACKLVDLDRSCYQYNPWPDHNAPLQEELVLLARHRPHYGYCRLHALPSRQGESASVRRVCRIYKQERLAVRRLRRKPLCRPVAQPPNLWEANQQWSLNFVFDAPATGRGIRVLTVVDAFTRECLILETDTSLSSQRVTRALEQIVERRGQPRTIKCNNGPELSSRHFLSWCGERHIQPGKPSRDGSVESFKGGSEMSASMPIGFTVYQTLKQRLQSGRASKTTAGHIAASVIVRLTSLRKY